MILSPSSLGDIIALVQLTTVIIKALANTTSSDECRIVMAELRSLSEAATIIMTLVEALPLHGATERLRMALERDVERCSKDTKKFLEVINPYYEVLCSTDPSKTRSVQEICRKLWWVLFKKGEASELMARIQGHRNKIVALANTIMIAHSTNVYSQAIQPSRSYTVHVTDFLSRKLPVPFDWCRTWEDFGRTMRSYLATGGIFHYQIREGRFIILGKNEEWIKPSRWAEQVRPGCTLQIFVAIDQFNHFSHKRSKGDCARCAESLPEVPGWKAHWRIAKMPKSETLEEHIVVCRLEQVRETDTGSNSGRVSCASFTPIRRALGPRY